MKDLPDWLQELWENAPRLARKAEFKLQELQAKLEAAEAKSAEWEKLARDQAAIIDSFTVGTMDLRLKLHKAEAALDRVRSITVEEIAKAIHVAFVSQMHYLRREATPSLTEMAEPVHRLLTERMEWK